MDTYERAGQLIERLPVGSCLNGEVGETSWTVSRESESSYLVALASRYFAGSETFATPHEAHACIGAIGGGDFHLTDYPHALREPGPLFTTT